jgi:hypothetical protein
VLAVEIVRAAWRLHRCAVAEAEDGINPATQASVDRARALAHNSLRRLLNDLRQFQSDRWLRAEVLRDGFDEANIGIADAHRVIKGLADDGRLRSQTIQTQLFGQVGQALSYQISNFALLSPKRSWWTPSLSNSASIRLDIGVCDSNLRWRPPCNCPDAPPATITGSGS